MLITVTEEVLRDNPPDLFQQIQWARVRQLIRTDNEILWWIWPELDNPCVVRGGQDG
jgi:hypothetical protein